MFVSDCPESHGNCTYTNQHIADSGHVGNLPNSDSELLMYSYIETLSPESMETVL